MAGSLHRLVLLIIVAFAACTSLASCAGDGSSGSSPDSLSNSDFLAAVQEVQQAGLTPYWLGAEFQVGPASFELYPETEILTESGNVHGVELWYEGGVTSTGPVYVTSDVKTADSLEHLRRRLLRSVGAEPEAVRVGPWTADLYVLSTVTRPVNQVWLVIDIGDVYVIATAFAVRNGIPGQDPNPLIDKDLLISVMAEHLRPYPE